ncbi:universal stress protein [Nocardia tengchongensis]|uniref:universal stress protein n=1 Tax=Nocardia tengchongensis TaxID=2055889 RepID=UPI0036ADD9EF
MVAVDGSETSYRSAAWAAVEATQYDRPLRIVTSAGLPTVWAPDLIWTDRDIQLAHDEGRRVVAEAARVARIAARRPIAVSTEVTFDPITAYLIDESRRAHTLVLGSSGLGALGRGLLGSVSGALTRHSHSPVAVVRSFTGLDPISAGQPVLVGIDGTPNSVPALERAFEEASMRRVGLTALHAWTDYSGALPFHLDGDFPRAEEEEILAERLAGFGEQFPDVQVSRILVRDRPVHALLEESERAQLLVVGSHGRGGFPGMLLGSTSSALVHTAPTPILVVRPDRARTP